MVCRSTFDSTFDLNMTAGEGQTTTPDWSADSRHWPSGFPDGYEVQGYDIETLVRWTESTLLDTCKTIELTGLPHAMSGDPTVVYPMGSHPHKQRTTFRCC